MCTCMYHCDVINILQIAMLNAEQTDKTKAIRSSAVTYSGLETRLQFLQYTLQHVDFVMMISMMMMVQLNRYINYAN